MKDSAVQHARQQYPDQVIQKMRMVWEKIRL